MSMPEARCHLIPLTTGQRVAVYEYGDPQGRPMFYFHGWPAAGVQGSMLDAPARELGIRVLSPDRPGIGCSDYQPQRRLLDWPPLLREVATALGITRCRVLGVSGGGPYALAAAWALPDLIEAVGVVCSAPPLHGVSDITGLQPTYQALLRLYARSPRAVQILFQILRPIGLWRPPTWVVDFMAARALPACDAAAVSDRHSGALALDAYRASWRQSAMGVFTDAEIYIAPWGFSLNEIKVPVRLWHGGEDQNFAPLFAEALARELPGCTFRLVPGEGHYSLPMRRAREIVADLLSVGANPLPA